MRALNAFKIVMNEGALSRTLSWLVKSTLLLGIRVPDFCILHHYHCSSLGTAFSSDLKLSKYFLASYNQFVSSAGTPGTMYWGRSIGQSTTTQENYEMP